MEVTSSTSVTLNNLSIKYGKTTAVEDLSLEIKQKELFVLLGPSGCGKSTTLNAIAGLIKPVAGEVLLGDQVVTSAEQDIFIRPQDRDLAMVFQDYAIYPHMTVFDNIAFPLEAKTGSMLTSFNRSFYKTFYKNDKLKIAKLIIYSIIFQCIIASFLVFSLALSGILSFLLFMGSIVFGVVIDILLLFAFFSVQEIKQERTEIEKRVNNVAKRLEIESFLTRKPRQLSGGQRQRVALGRAIIREPKAFLMDEPLSNLDAKLRVYARAELKNLHKRLDATIIYVTHDQIEAMSIGDRIAILNCGILEQVGEPEYVYNNPINLFVAGFIGDPPINMIEGTLVEENGNVFVDLGINAIKFKIQNGNMIKNKAQDSEVIIGVRPEHIKIVNERDKNAYQAKINVIEPAGREYIIHVSIGDRSLVVVANSDEIHEIYVGKSIFISIEDKKMHIFDKKTERNLHFID